MNGESNLWWELPESELHHAVSDNASNFRESTGARKTRYRRFSKIFSDFSVSGLDAEDSKDAAIDLLTNREPTVNFSRSIANSIQNSLFSVKPKPSVVTEGGEWDLQRKARKMDKFIWGVFYMNNFYGPKMAPLIGRDAFVWGTGVVKVCGEISGPKSARKGFIRLERAYPWEIFTDQIDEHYGCPRSFYQCRLMDKSRLKALFPKSAEHIEELKPALAANGLATERYGHMVWVTEAWHLPSVPGAKDGKHAIVVEGATLACRQWKTERPPFAFLHWEEPLTGFWGNSGLEDVEGIQLEHNELMVKIQAAMYHHATPKWLVPAGGNVSMSEIDNDIAGCEVRYEGGVEPKLQAFTTVSPELFAQSDRLKQLAHEVTGVSELMASAKKPGGLDSGVALREFNDNQSQRFSVQGSAFENCITELGKIIVDEARRLEADGAAVSVRSEVRKRRRDTVEKIDWKKVSIDEDAFVLKVMSANSMTRSPSFRMQMASELAQTGYISKEMFLQLIEMPDTEAALNMELAPYELILDQLEDMLEEDVPKQVVPEPFQDIEMVRTVATRVYLQAKREKAPEDRLELLRQYIFGADRLQKQALSEQAMLQDPAMQQQGPPPVGPEGLPPEALPPGLPTG
jgi:hypothetical protein